MARNKANYQAKKHAKLQEKYTKSHEKYLKTLTECKSRGKENQMTMQFCINCITMKFGENIFFCKTIGDIFLLFGLLKKKLIKYCFI